MSAFGAANVERLDFDFREFPRASGTGNCSGHGFVPEPTDERLVRFLGLAAAMPQEDDATFPEGLAVIRTEVAAFCAGHPTPAEIAELPPRVLLAFVRWLSESFAPKG